MTQKVFFFAFPTVLIGKIRDPEISLLQDNA